MKRIFIEMKECVVLLLNGQFFENVNDIVMVLHTLPLNVNQFILLKMTMESHY